MVNSEKRSSPEDGQRHDGSGDCVFGQMKKMGECNFCIPDFESKQQDSGLGKNSPAEAGDDAGLLKGQEDYPIVVDDFESKQQDSGLGKNSPAEAGDDDGHLKGQEDYPIVVDDDDDFQEWWLQNMRECSDCAKVFVIDEIGDLNVLSYYLQQDKDSDTPDESKTLIFCKECINLSVFGKTSSNAYESEPEVTEPPESSSPEKVCCDVDSKPAGDVVIALPAPPPQAPQNEQKPKFDDSITVFRRCDECKKVLPTDSSTFKHLEDTMYKHFLYTLFDCETVKPHDSENGRSNDDFVITRKCDTCDEEFKKRSLLVLHSKVMSHPYFSLLVPKKPDWQNTHQGQHQLLNSTLPDTKSKQFGGAATYKRARSESEDLQTRGTPSPDTKSKGFKRVRFSEPGQQQPEDSGSKRKKCQLKIRLPDGSMLRDQFDPNAKLSDVRMFVLMRSNGLVLGSFSLNYNRHRFTDEEMEESLQNLGLMPSALMLVVLMEN